MIIEPGTTWGDIQEILDNMDEPLKGPTNFFSMTREEIMAFPPGQEVFPEDEDEDEDLDVPTD